MSRGLRWESLPEKSRSKYKNQKVVDPTDGKVIDSKKELKVRQQLRARFKAGEIVELAEQVWIRLSPDRKMIVDFVFTDSAGQKHYWDAKGYATRDWKTKQAWARSLGIEIEAV